MAKSPTEADIDDGAIRKLADLLDETGLNEIEVAAEGWTIRVAKGAAVTQAVAAPAPAAPLPSAAPGSAPEAEGDAADHPGAVTSPMVGVAYLSPDPDSPAFVKVGDQVSEGQTLCLVEAMKVFNPIAAPKAGKVTRILINSGDPVEFGEPLIVVE